MTLSMDGVEAPYIHVHVHR